MQQKTTKQWLTVKEAAEYLGVSAITIRRWTENGELPCYRIGRLGHRRFKPDDLERYVQQHQYHARLDGQMQGTILVVADVPATATLLRDLLEDEGYAIAHVSDGEALFVAIEHDCPDLIVIDMVSSNLDGYGLLARLKQTSTTANIPALVLSPHNDVPWTVYTVAGDTTNPFDVRDLVAAVRQSLAGTSTQHQENQYAST